MPIANKSMRKLRNKYRREGRCYCGRIAEAGYRNCSFHRAYYRQRLYGIKPEAYQALVESQAGRCAICKTIPTTQKRALAVDHDHATGRIRGLLCHYCNGMLGHARDNVEILLT